MAILLALLAAGTCVFLLIAATRASKKGSPPHETFDQRFSELGAQLGGQVADRQLSFSRDGRAFFAKLTYAGKNQPPTLDLWTEVDDATRDAGDSTAAYRSDPRVKVLGRPEVLVRKETDRDRLGKRLGINREVEIGDEAFDLATYIESYYADEDVKKVLGDARARAAATRLLDQGFASVVVNKEITRLSAVRPIAALGQLEAAAFERAAGTLAEMALALPIFEGRARVRQWSPAGVGSIVASVACMLVALIGYGVSVGRWRPLDAGPGWTGFAIGVAVFIALMAIIAALVRGRSDSFRTFLVCFFALVFGAPLSSMAVTVMLNGILDEAPPEDHQTAVIGKWTTTSRSSTTYYLRLEDWKPERGRVEIPVDSKLYREVSIGDAMIASTGPGRFGWEWLRELKPHTLELFERPSRREP